MKKYTILVAGLVTALAAASQLAVAEDKGKRERMDPEQRLQRMQEHLGLSEEQASEIRAIGQSDLSREERRNQVGAVLTDDQRAQLEEHRAKRREHHSRGGDRPEHNEETN